MAWTFTTLKSAIQDYTNASQYLALFSMSGLHSSTATNFDGFRFLRSSNVFYGNGTITLYGLVS